MAYNEKISKLEKNIQKVFVGKNEVIQLVLTGLLSNGHILIEDVPGVGKTTLSRALAKSIDCSFQRIQFTPDQLPSDILGVSVYDNKKNEFVFSPGPIFANIILADEINRTTPRTQSALLEAMNDCQVTIDRKTYPLEHPFMVLATQNPYEFEGTYPLPESQLDRFLMKINIGYPDTESERRVILDQRLTHPIDTLEAVIHREEVIELQKQARQVAIDESLVSYMLEVVDISRNFDRLDVGISPRGAIAFYKAAQAYAFIQGRDYVIPDDLKLLATAVFSHRVISRAAVHGLSGDANSAIIEEILSRVPVPI
ncbi:AAA family ATPase [Planctomycetota bacterium]